MLEIIINSQSFTLRQRAAAALSFAFFFSEGRLQATWEMIKKILNLTNFYTWKAVEGESWARNEGKLKFMMRAWWKVARVHRQPFSLFIRGLCPSLSWLSWTQLGWNVGNKFIRKSECDEWVSTKVGGWTSRIL